MDAAYVSVILTAHFIRSGIIDLPIINLIVPMTGKVCVANSLFFITSLTMTRVLKQEVKADHQDLDCVLWIHILSIILSLWHERRPSSG